LSLIKHQILPSKLPRVVPQLGRQLLAARQRILDPLFSLEYLTFLRFEGFPVDVLAAFSGVTTVLWWW
jgi:hypothetical protein